MSEKLMNEIDDSESKAVKVEDWNKPKPLAEGENPAEENTQPTDQSASQIPEDPLPEVKQISEEEAEQEMKDAAIAQARINKAIRYGKVRQYLSKKLNRRGDTIDSPLSNSRINIDNKIEYLSAIISWAMSILSNPDAAKSLGSEVVALMDGATYMIEVSRLCGNRVELDAMIDCVYLGFIQDVYNCPTDPLDPVYFKSYFERKNIAITKDFKRERLRGMLIDIVHKGTNIEQMIDLFLDYRDNVIGGHKLIVEMEK